MKPVVATVLVLATALTVRAIIWVAPVVGVKHSASEQSPRTSNCR